MRASLYKYIWFKFLKVCWKPFWHLTFHKQPRAKVGAASVFGAFKMCLQLGITFKRGKCKNFKPGLPRTSFLSLPKVFSHSWEINATTKLDFHSVHALCSKVKQSQLQNLGCEWKFCLLACLPAEFSRLTCLTLSWRCRKHQQHHWTARMWRQTF